MRTVAAPDGLYVKRFVAVTVFSHGNLAITIPTSPIVRIRLGEVIEAGKVHTSGVALIVHDLAKPNAK